MYGCKGCGAMLKYDIALGKMKCNHCDSAYEVEEFPDLSYNKSECEAYVFECPQCGGIIYTQNNDLTGRCEYCGTTQVFQSRVESIQRPMWIVPFTKDKEYCKSVYQSAVKRAIYAPKEIKNPEYMDSIKGIYMPYWIYNSMTDKNILLRGVKANSVHRDGDYLHSKIVTMDTKFEARFHAMLGDASSWYSDEISSNIRPFSLSGTREGLRPYNPAYLCGFYGETADVSAPKREEIREYDKQVAKSSREFVFKEGNNKMGLESGMEQAEKPTKSGAELGLLPVWFLSYNRKNRVSYSVINGQTGQMAVEFPVDMKKFLLGTLGVAALLFLVLNIFWVMRPEYIALAAAIGAMWGIHFFNRDLREISRKAIASAPPDKQKNAVRHERIKLKASPYPYIVLGLLILAENLGFVDRHPFGLMVLLPILLTTWAVVCGSLDIWRDIRVSLWGLKYVGVKVFPGYVFAYLSMLISLMIQIVRPVSDSIYFGVSFLCMAMTLLCFISLIAGYNRMATRKMPQFEHLGGDDYGK